MIYAEFSRINEIDTEVGNLHQRLNELYGERAQILRQPVSAVPAPADYQPDTQAYEAAARAWQALGVKVPAYRYLQARLKKAQAVIASLQRENPVLEDKLQIILVPPYAQLKKLQTSAGQPVIAASDSAPAYEHVTRWRVVVCFDPQFDVYIGDLMAFFEQHEYLYKEYDLRGLGVQELIASELQRNNWPADHEWVLPLKQVNGQEASVPCVTKQGEQFIIDGDEPSCLLGRNYFRSAIFIS